MRRVLHILTRPDDALAREIIARQKGEGAEGISVVDLTAPGRDYQRLVEQIFEADSVECW